ncbi:T9SS type A sorting domain-containing protein [Candidatus Nomurabacteria bacterium]|nr:T9SS type A sorting domain-containing protein [Candidatus Nomurabacteria bacterium]
MKKIIIISFLVLILQGSTAQNMVPLPTYENKKNYMDSLYISLQSQSDSLEFRIIHPVYDSAFWNEEYVQKFTQEFFHLDQNSTAFEIVSSEAWFIKSNGLQINSGLIQGTTDDPSRGLGDTEYRSTQCGNYRRKLFTRAQKQNIALGNDSLVFREVSLDGHQIMEYWDATLQKWVFIDPDPGTTVFIPRKNGQLVSFAEIQNDPTILLDTTSLVYFRSRYNTPTLACERYYDFMVAIINTVTYWPPKYISDSRRDILYRIPPGSSLHMGVRLQDIFLNTNDIGSNEEIDSCQQLFLQGDTVGFMGCLPGVTTLLNISPEEFLVALSDENVHTTSETTAPTRIGFDQAGWYITLTLPPGSYNKHDVQIDHPVRSLHVNESPLFYDDSLYTTTTYNRIYWPSGTSDLGNPPPIDPRTIHYGIDTIYSADSIMIDFYVNHKFWAFWEDIYQLYVTKGTILFEKSWDNETFITNQEKRDKTILIYPNPTTGNITFSRETNVAYEIYNLLGKRVAVIPAGTTQYDLSTHPQGIYIIPALGKKIVKK